MVFQIFFFFLDPGGISKKEPDERMKFRRTNKVGKFDVKKENKEAMSKNQNN